MNNAAKALGRSYGALFFSLFGACWLVLSSYAFGGWKASQLLAILLVLAVLVSIAIRIKGRAKLATGPQVPDEQRKRDDRAFGILNAVQWVAVFLIFTFFPKLGLSDLAFPAALVVIGLHFFAMPPSYRHTANFVTGAALVVWAILCSLLFKGDRRIAFLALGAGFTLWVSAAWALAFATRHLRQDPIEIMPV